MHRRTGSAGLCFFIVAAAASAQTDTVQLHGFGGWAYGDTDGNAYLEGSDDGNAENTQLSLAVSASPTERLRVSAQVEFFIGLEGELEEELDYVFAEWAISDRWSARLGRGKHPFGIYTEVFDVGTLRPFFDLPQGFYGPSGLAGESYDGLDVSGRRRAGDWTLEWDAYFGTLSFEAVEPWDLLFEDDDSDDEPVGDDGVEAIVERKKRDETLGFRLDVQTPVDGLRFGVSAYSGTAEDDEGVSDDPNQRHQAWGLHLEYEHESWSLRAELGRLDEEDEIVAESAYVELARRFGPHWQLAARWDRTEVDVLEVDATSFRALTRHEDLGLSVNYWFAPEMVVRLGFHSVDGNRFALPEDLDDLLEGQADDRTTLVQVGMQFSF